MSTDAIKKAFKEFDLDGDGQIEKWELKKALEKCGQQPSIREIDELVKEVDKNKDGKLQLEEFEELYKKIQKNEYAASVGGVAKLMKLRMQDVGKYPEPSGKWKKVGDSGFYGAAGGGVYHKEGSAKGPPPKKSISDLP